MKMRISLSEGSIDGELMVHLDRGLVKAQSVSNAVDLLNETHYPFALLQSDHGDRVIAVAHIVSVKEYRPAQVVPKPPGM